MVMTRRNFGIVTGSIVVAVSDARTGAMAMFTNLDRFKAIVGRGFSQGDLTVETKFARRSYSSTNIFLRPTFPDHKSYDHKLKARGAASRI